MIVTGLGGGTGTGIAPVVARIAQRQGCKTAAVVTKPMPWEGRGALVYALVELKMLACVERYYAPYCHSESQPHSPHSHRSWSSR
jgi:hypothetical protein